MEAVGIRAIRAEGGFISQDERNLDDSSESSSHQRVTKNTVDHSADHKMLGMGRHGKAGEKNDNSGDQVPLGLTVSLTAHPDPQKPGAPPDYTHGSVLQIVMRPGLAPSMFSKGVDTSPGGDHQGVEELLTPPGAAQPKLAHQKENCQQDSVGDEGTTHDKMSQTLSQMVLSAVAHGRDTSEQHLNPAGNRHCLAQNPMRNNDKAANPSMNPPGEMQFQIHTQHDLYHHHEHQGVCEGGMDILGELATLVAVAEEVGHHCDDRSDNLERDMPPGSYDLYSEFT